MYRAFAILAIGALATGCSGKKIDELETQLEQCTSAKESCEADLKKQAAVVGKDPVQARMKNYKRLKKMLEAAFKTADTDAEVVIADGLLAVRLSSDIMFASGSADLNDEGKKALDSTAEVLTKEEKDREFLIAGHTDSDAVGSKSKYADNWELSTARAVAAVRYLVEKGVDAEKIAAAGYGEHQPVAGNDTDANKAKNRRTEIVFLPTPGERAQARAENKK